MSDKCDMNQADQKITVRLPDSLKRAIKAQAKRQHLSPSEYIRRTFVNLAAKKAK